MLNLNSYLLYIKVDRETYLTEINPYNMKS